MTGEADKEAGGTKAVFDTTKLPDALVYATAKEVGCELVTCDTKDFDPATLSDIVVPFTP